MTSEGDSQCQITGRQKQIKDEETGQAAARWLRLMHGLRQGRKIKEPDLINIAEGEPNGFRETEHKN